MTQEAPEATPPEPSEESSPEQLANTVRMQVGAACVFIGLTLSHVASGRAGELTVAVAATTAVAAGFWLKVANDHLKTLTGRAQAAEPKEDPDPSGSQSAETGSRQQLPPAQPGLTPNPEALPYKPPATYPAPGRRSDASGSTHGESTSGRGHRS